MKKVVFALFIAVIACIGSANAQGSQPRKPTPGGTCGYVKIIPNSPNPIRVVCYQPSAANCGGFCATHCVRLEVNTTDSVKLEAEKPKNTPTSINRRVEKKD